MERDSNIKPTSFDKLTKFFKNLGLILGAVAVAIGLYKSVVEGSLVVKSMKLSSLDHIEKLIATDTEIREKIGPFISKYDSTKLRMMLDSVDYGKLAYLSQELSDLRIIGRHYDKMGALVKLGYVDFDLLYEIIPFPDDFWMVTDKFRHELKTSNWSSDNKGLPDFWKNFEALRKLYIEKRKEDACEE